MTSNGDAGHALHAAPPAGPDTRRDPAMKALFRMSRTAGVGLQDYAEVNVLAVVGVILGALSFIAFAARDSAPVLIVPALAVVVCLFAIVQVRRSNGTQTGLPLAIAGLLLAIGFASTNVAAHVQTTRRENQYHAELNALVAKLLDASTTQGVDGAYQLFDARFRETTTPETFQRVVQPRLQHYFIGKPITSITVGDLVVYETDETGLTTATTLMVMKGNDPLPDGSPAVVTVAAEFRRTDLTGWRIHAIPSWFGDVKKPGIGGP